MVGGGNAGSVYVQLELKGVNEAESKLKQFERSIKNAMDKGTRSVKSFGRAVKTSLGNLKTSISNTVKSFGLLGKIAIGAAIGKTFVDATRNALALERAVLSLNTSLGANGTRAFAFATKTAREYGLSLNKTVQSFSKFTAAATAANIPLKVQEDLFDAVTRSAVTFGMTSSEIDGAF